MFFRHSLIALTLLGSSYLFSSHALSVPQLLWPQKDVKGNKILSNSNKIKVLIAARASEYKDSLIALVTRDLTNDSTSVSVIGMEKLDSVKAQEFQAILLVNTCLGWELDRNILRFLKKNKELQSKVIVVTTSGDGGWLPKKHTTDVYDAIATASEQTSLEKKSGEVSEKLKIIITNLK